MCVLFFLVAPFSSDTALAANPEFTAFESDIFSVPGSGLSPTGQQPLLTILYNAMTHGELHPCPT